MLSEEKLRLRPLPVRRPCHKTEKEGVTPMTLTRPTVLPDFPLLSRFPNIALRLGRDI